MKVLFFAAIMICSATGWSKGLVNNSKFKIGGIKLGGPIELRDKPVCVKNNDNSCGFNYSWSYQETSHSANNYQKCELTYWEPLTKKESKLTFYTNCGTCITGAIKNKNSDWTSVESPVTQLIDKGSKELKVCNKKKMQVGVQSLYAWSFRVKTIEQNSSCRDEYASGDYFLFPTKESSYSDGINDACVNY